MRMLNQRVDDGLGIFTGSFNQHHIARLAFDEGRNLTVTTAAQQVPFPVTGYRPVCHRGRTLADRYRIGNSAVVVCLLRMMARAALNSCAPQMLHQLLLQRPKSLNEKAAIDGLV